MQYAIFQNKRCYESILEFGNHLHPCMFHVQGCLSSERLLEYSKGPHNSVWPLGMSDQLSISYFQVKLSRWNATENVNREVLSCIPNKYFSQQRVQRISHLRTQRLKFRVQPPQLNIQTEISKKFLHIKNQNYDFKPYLLHKDLSKHGKKVGTLLKDQLM
jgi:hypothetical protein